MKNKAFTLIEILVVIAIVGVLSAVVLVSMSSYGKKARASRVMAQASTVVPSIVRCWGNGGEVLSPSSVYICEKGSGYGSWPTLPSAYSFNNISNVSGVKKTSWYFTADGESQTICCNSAMNSCAVVDSGSCSTIKTWQ